MKMMFKVFASVYLLGLLCCGTLASKCTAAVGTAETWDQANGLGWAKKDDDCVKNITAHIKDELNAAMTYIAMGAHFLNSANFRPGVAHMFLKHGNEERQHAIALMDYVLLRGNVISADMIPQLKPKQTTWDSVMMALKEAFTIERDVRDSFTRIIQVCEGDENNENDYHVSDFLTGNFLGEQHEGVREISNLITTLGRLLQSNGNNNVFAEYEFDMTLRKED